MSLVKKIRKRNVVYDIGVDYKNIENIPFLSLERLGAYIYKVSFDALPEYQAQSNDSIPMGCTSFVRDGKLYRNLDWNYSNTAEFLVQTKNFEGMSFITGLNDGEIDVEKIAQLPYHLNDGVNNDGIRVSTHILYNDWGYTGSGDKNISIITIPFHILNELHDINDINSVLGTYLNNIQIPTGLQELGYLIQFLVTDGTTTYALLPPESASGAYQIVNITSNPKLTNFRWVNRVTVVRTEGDIQDRPTGIERWNLISDNTTLEDLRFTQCYVSPNRLSEFIGIDETNKYSTDEELTIIYNKAHAAYETRTRDGQTWQSVHSVVYGDKDIEHLWVQEDYDVDYAGINFEEIDTDIDNKISIHNQDSEAHQDIRDAIKALNSISIRNINAEVITTTETNVQTTATQYIITNYLRQPINWDGLILTLTDKQNDKILYIYSETSNTWINAGINSVDLSNYVNKTDDETIAGIKTFIDIIKLSSSADSGIYGDQYGNIKVKRNGTDIAAFASAFQPTADNSKDLGVSTFRWRNLYLSGNLSDGTNSITVANIANKNNVIPVIDAPSSAKLTTEQANIFKTSGCVVKGAFPSSSYVDSLFLPARDMGQQRYQGIIISGNSQNATVGLYRITGDDNTLALVSNLYYLNLNNINNINGKKFPLYPTDTTKQYKLVQQTNGTLAWVEDIVIPTLPDDASSKTYALKAINGVLTWVE